MVMVMVVMAHTIFLDRKVIRSTIGSTIEANDIGAECRSDPVGNRIGDEANDGGVVGGSQSGQSAVAHVEAGQVFRYLWSIQHSSVGGGGGVVEGHEDLGSARFRHLEAKVLPLSGCHCSGRWLSWSAIEYERFNN
jgi:hypothetical protein